MFIVHRDSDDMFMSQEIGLDLETLNAARQLRPYWNLMPKEICSAPGVVLLEVVNSNGLRPTMESRLQPMAIFG